MNLVFVGPQASGKGTQAKIIGKELGFIPISIGNIFREAITKKTKLGKQIEEIINNGDFVPDELSDEIMKKKVIKLNSQNKKVIMDGFPRDEIQAKFCLKNIPIYKVIVIEVKDETSIKRIKSRYHCPKCKKKYNTIYPELKPKKRGICDLCKTKLVKRHDDYPKAIKKRLKTYHELTVPMLKVFKNKVIKINGEQSIEQVRKDILNKLKKAK
jgi:adenylate kinase